MARGETRDKLLAAARELMLARGYSATAVDDICARAEVSKGSFYHFFASKEELGLAVLASFYEEGLRRVGSGDYLHIPEPEPRLWGFFDHLEVIAPDFWRQGCLMGNFATELAESSPAIHARIAEMFSRLVDRLAPLFRPIADGEEDARELAEQTLIVLEGSIVMARAHDDPQRIAAGVRRHRRSLEERRAGARTAGGR